MSPRFQLGRVVATPAALELAEADRIDVRTLLRRHMSGDWGDVGAEDRKANEDALANGARILSVYGKGERRIWVITDALTDVCPACWAGLGTCEPLKGEWQAGTHFRTDLPERRVSTTVLLPSDY